MSKYDEMSLEELFVLWVENWKAMQTGIREIAGNDPMPDPREMAEILIRMPKTVWLDMFTHERFRDDLKKKMDIQEMMANIQLENVSILNAALAKEIS